MIGTQFKDGHILKTDEEFNLGYFQKSQIKTDRPGDRFQLNNYFQQLDNFSSSKN